MLSAPQQIILTAQDDALPSSVILNGAKILWKKNGKWDSNTEWRLMTVYRFPHHSHRFFAALRMTSYGLPCHGHRHFTFASDDACRPVSFWTEAKILCEKDRKRNSDTEWRIYYADGVTDSLPLVLLFVFLHIVFDRSYSVWRVFLYNRVFVIFMCIYNFSKIREE